MNLISFEAYYCELLNILRMVAVSPLRVPEEQSHRPGFVHKKKARRRIIVTVEGTSCLNLHDSAPQSRGLLQRCEVKQLACQLVVVGTCPARAKDGVKLGRFWKQEIAFKQVSRIHRNQARAII
jgi:hypothetical protein